MKRLQKLKKYALTHKIISSVVIIIILVIGYVSYKKVFGGTAAPQYILTTVRKGTISQTVTGSGQVSAENQLDVSSEVSGKILSIQATVGQHVKTGDLIATLDSHDALADLESTRIAYAKLTEPAKVGDLTNAENSVSKSYSDGFSTISDAFLHVPVIMTGLKDMFYSRAGYLSDQQAGNITETGRGYISTAAHGYDTTNNDYAAILDDYKKLSKTSPAATIDTMISKTTTFMKEISEVLKEAQSAVTFISVSQPDYNPAGATGVGTSITTWSGQVNSDISSLLSARNAIASNADALYKLNQGADSLDIQSQQLTLEQKQRAYEKYFIRAPFEGVIGRIPVHVFDQANGGTVIATVSSDQKITTIPLNEVDAVKVAKNQKVTLTFDALQGLKVDGLVTEVDLVGTASQGVVTYNVKIAFGGNDERIRAGMSVDASIVTAEKDNVLVVPASAVKTQGIGRFQTSYVEVLDAQNVLQKKTVVAGETDDTNTEIVSGVDEGQKIVARTLAAGATAPKGTTPTIFGGLGGGQNNVIRNANRTAR